MKIRKLIAAVLSLCMVGGAFAFNAPQVRDYSITADAAGECYTFNSTTGLLTLKGKVVLDEITGFGMKENVLSITTAKGTILPQDCTDLFSDYNYCESMDLSNADTSSVKSMDSMFYNCEQLTSLDLSSFDTSNVTDMAYMFDGCTHLTSIDLSSFDTSNVTNMAHMFEDCMDLSSLDLSRFDTSNVTDMAYMFSNCWDLTSLDLSNFDTSNVTSMGGMFEECIDLISLDLSNFDTSSVTVMSMMFYQCYDMKSLDVSSFNTSKVTHMHAMFEGCTSLTSLDLSSFDMSSIDYSDGMFSDCTGLLKLTLGKYFGDITMEHELPNDNGWSNENDPSTVVSGSGEFAEFENSGKNTYVKYWGITITEQPPGLVRFETYDSVNIPLQATGKDLHYSWYVKKVGMSNFTLYDEFNEDEWTGSFDFTGMSENGLQASFHGAQMYCKVWNNYGAEVESRHFILQAYRGDVDRNITIRLPEVGETYAHYMADVNSIVPAELIIGDEYFGIVPMDADGNYIPGVHAMTDDDVFKAGYRYEFCFNMHLPEYVSPMAIYQFYSKALIVNGEEHGGADSVDENELYFTDFWTTPVLKGGLIKGDANADGNVNLNDAVAVLQYVALSAKYPLDADALDAADVCDYGTSGINGNDALVIMMVDAGLLEQGKLPVKSSDI